jgi:hypothetical protein
MRPIIWMTKTGILGKIDPELRNDALAKLSRRDPTWVEKNVGKNNQRAVGTPYDGM